jgi:hypothetical protein
MNYEATDRYEVEFKHISNSGEIKGTEISTDDSKAEPIFSVI